MTPALPLGAALKRGAWVTLANWPVVLVDFTIESVFKVAFAIPVLGGAFMVAVLLGADINLLVSGDVRASASVVMRSLLGAPVALMAFLVAVGMVSLGGALLMHIVKSGTISVLVNGDRQAGEFHREGFSRDVLRRAHAFSLAAIIAGARRFARRTVTLTIWLCVAYLIVGAAVFAVVALQAPMTASRWAPAWPLLMLLAGSASVVTFTVIGATFDLLRLVTITDDCRTREAARRLRHFLIVDARDVIGIFAVMTAIVAGATAVSLSAVAGITVVAWTPLIGLLVVPLQLAAWMVRGMLLQCLGLAGLSAYQTQYRRFSHPAAAPALRSVTSAS